MAQKRYINIQFPFRDDPEGKFLDMNSEAKKAIKADLMHLLLTNKGERLYMPDFGSNLRQFIFEQNDDIALNSIRNEINESVKKFIPNLTITELSTVQSDENIHATTVKIDYVVSNGAFQSADFVTLKL
jgi:hypothetical protein